jgi:hypothetical protein
MSLKIVILRVKARLGSYLEQCLWEQAFCFDISLEVLH